MGVYGVMLVLEILTYLKYAAVSPTSQALARLNSLPLSAPARHSSSRLDSTLAYSQPCIHLIK